jgi:thiamine-monophosphate kinase
MLRRDMKIREIGEFGLIELIESRVGRASYPVIIGIGDDASVLDGDSGYDLVTTTDMLIEGVHFLRERTPPFDLGYKSHAVNLSDVAAMGATPVQSFLSLALPPEADVSSVESFLEGFLEAGEGVQLCGGDTVSSPSGWAISVTVIGRAPAGRVLRRDGAVPGESIWLCGPVGDSAAGLAILLGKVEARSEEEADYLIARHNRPIPCLQMGWILVQTDLSRCAIDLSDGLLQDLGHICLRSGVGAQLDIERIPLSPQITNLASDNGQDPLKWALSGGEDYSLLFTVKPDDEKRLSGILENEGIDAVPIGKIIPGKGITLLKGGKPVKFDSAGGFDHFKSSSK